MQQEYIWFMLTIKHNNFFFPLNLFFVKKFNYSLDVLFKITNIFEVTKFIPLPKYGPYNQDIISLPI